MRIIKPQEGSDPIPDELLEEIAQLLAGPDGAVLKVSDGWVYDKPQPLPDDGAVWSQPQNDEKGRSAWKD